MKSLPLVLALAALGPALSPASAAADGSGAPHRAAASPDGGRSPGMTEDEAAPPEEPDEQPAPPPPRAPPAESPDPGRAERSEHTVGPHDTLGGIAHHYGITTDSLAQANGITRLTPIRIGQRLIVPAPGEAVRMPGRSHIVGQGNTLGSIARRYGVTVDALFQANHLKHGEPLHLGQKLVIPGTAAVDSSPGAGAEDRDSAPVPETGLQELAIPGSGPAYYYEPTGPGRSGMRPVIVYLHGRGAEPKQYCKRWSRVARNLGWLVCPSGPEDRGDGKRGWNNSWPAGRNVVMAAIDGLRRKYGRRVQLYGNTLIGFSEGAFVAMNVGLREPHTFNRWLILGADTDYWGAAGLATLPEARGRVRRVYLITGGHDDVVDDAAKVRKWLSGAGVPVRVSTPRDMGHEVALDTKPAMYQAALRWLAQG